MSVSEDSHTIGVDLGGSNVRACLVDGGGVTLAELAEPTARGDADEVVAQVLALGRGLIRKAGLEWTRVAGVGVGVPGVIAGRALTMAPNLPPFGDFELARVLETKLGADVVVDNDVNMATLGEHRLGRGAGIADFVLIAVGTGVGMGIVSGGRLLRGARGAAGEIGTMPLGTGELEEIAGGTSVARRFAERSGAVGQTSHDVFAAAAAGDAHAVAVLEEQARGIAVAAGVVQTVLDPELIVLDGGIGRREDFVARVQELTGGTVRIERSALGGRAGIVGAAEAARDHVRERIGA